MVHCFRNQNGTLFHCSSSSRGDEIHSTHYSPMNDAVDDDDPRPLNNSKAESFSIISALELLLLGSIQKVSDPAQYTEYFHNHTTLRLSGDKHVLEIVAPHHPNCSASETDDKTHTKNYFISITRLFTTYTHTRRQGDICTCPFVAFHSLYSTASQPWKRSSRTRQTDTIEEKDALTRKATKLFRFVSFNLCLLGAFFLSSLL